MKCVECETEPLTPGHYCECCGRKLSLQERRALDATSPAPRCQSCGGPTQDGDLCKPCTKAFAPVLGSPTIQEPPRDSATTVAQRAPIAVKPTAPTPPPAVSAEPIKINVESIKIDVFKSETAKTVADQTAKAYLAKGANPPPVSRRPVVPAQPQQRSRATMWIAAGAVMVVAIGAAEGARRLGFNWSQLVAPEEQAVQAATGPENGTAVGRGSAPPDDRSVPKVSAENRASATVPTRAASPSKQKTVPGGRRSDRQERATEPQAAPVVAPVPALETPAPVAAKPPAVAAREPAPPTGRFFERNDVDEPPQIATRVEPQLPANLSSRARNDVVVVRVLVSSTGHPFRVTLLRGSRLGRASDEAVVAAVTRWTFSPAKKRGEPVNCWYNIGVPLGQAN